MSNFNSIVSNETVSSLGLNMSLWGDEEQSRLREVMLLLCKENPEWTDREMKDECENQIELIFFEWFQECLARLVTKSNGWPTLGEAYAEFRTSSLKDFLKTVQKHQEYQDFCEEFYDDLRDMWNICSAGMRDEYTSMKAKGWSKTQYRMWLDKEIETKGKY